MSGAAVPEGPLEMADPSGIHLSAVELWCAAMRAAGAADTALVLARAHPARDPGELGALTHLSGWPRATCGPVPPRKKEAP